MYNPVWIQEVKKIENMGWQSEDTGGCCFASFKNFNGTCIAVNDECIVLHSVPCSEIELNSEQTEREVIHVPEVLKNGGILINEIKEKFGLDDDQASDVFSAFRVYSDYNKLVQEGVVPTEKPGEELKQALRQFKEAAYNLSVVLDDEGMNVLTENYPFNKELREKISQIIDWANTHLKENRVCDACGEEKPYLEFISDSRCCIDCLENLIDWDRIDKIVGLNRDLVCNNQAEAVSFLFNGINVWNPFLDEFADRKVMPLRYYGEVFLKSDFVKYI